MKRVHLIAILFFCYKLGFSQLWEPVGGGVSSFGLGLYGDSVSKKLYVVGQFRYGGDSSLLNGVAVWDGNALQTVGGGLPDGPWQTSSMSNRPMSICNFQDQVFIAGTFDTVAATYPIQNNARWDGVVWRDCGYSIDPLGLDEANEELFGFGIIHDGLDAPMQAFGRWNGSEFERFGTQIDFPHLGLGPYKVEYYRGEYYFGGNFHEMGDLKEIMRWNGVEWRPLKSGVLGDAAVMGLQVYKEQLFVGGPFYKGDGNPADGLMAWDGNEWYNPFPQVQFVSQVNKMAVIGNSLYIVGRYYISSKKGWSGPYGIARYDGNEFCAFGGLNIYPWDVAGFDDQIFVTANYTMVNSGGIGYPGDTVKYLGRWIGQDSVDICVLQPLRVEEPSDPPSSLSLFPNPVHSNFSLALPSSAQEVLLRVFDLTGREVIASRQYDLGSPPIEVKHLSAGLYFVEVMLRGKKQVIKLVKE